MQPDASDLMGRLKKLQNQFTDLLHISERDNMELSSGQMLLMGFNGLFSRLDDDFSSLLDAIDSLDVPDSWKKVDVIREAKSMQVGALCVAKRQLRHCDQWQHTTEPNEV